MRYQQAYFITLTQWQGVTNATRECPAQLLQPHLQLYRSAPNSLQCQLPMCMLQ